MLSGITTWAWCALGRALLGAEARVRRGRVGLRGRTLRACIAGLIDFQVRTGLICGKRCEHMRRVPGYLLGRMASLGK